MFFLFFLSAALFSNQVENVEKFGAVLAVTVILGFWLYLGTSLISSNFAFKKDIKEGIKYCGNFFVEQKEIEIPDEGDNQFLLFVRISNDKIKLVMNRKDFDFVDLHQYIYLEFLPKSKEIIYISYKDIVLEKPVIRII